MAHILVLYLKGLIYLSWFNNSSMNTRSLETKNIQVGIHFVQIPQTSEMPCRSKFRSWPTIIIRLISLKTRCVNNFVGLKKRKGDWLPRFFWRFFFFGPPGPLGRLLQRTASKSSNCRMTAYQLEVPRSEIPKHRDVDGKPGDS